MESSPAARPQPLRELPHKQGQNDRQNTEIASSEPCGYIDDVTATVAEKVSTATVVDRSETAIEVTAIDKNNPTADEDYTTAMKAAAENNPTAMRAADESNPTVVTAADEEVTAAAAPATLQITTDEKAVTAAARVSEVSFIRKFKRFLIIFHSDTDLIGHHARVYYLRLSNRLHVKCCSAVTILWC